MAQIYEAVGQIAVETTFSESPGGKKAAPHEQHLLERGLGNNAYKVDWKWFQAGNLDSFALFH
jgi:hypothetical protein